MHLKRVFQQFLCGSHAVGPMALRHWTNCMIGASMILNRGINMRYPADKLNVDWFAEWYVKQHVLNNLRNEYN
jgi:hypothetical protein